MEEAYFAGGCFWCTEAIFKNLKGVVNVVSGYSGGNMENPSYEEVSSGTTSYAETIKITFDPGIISFLDLVYVFMKTHDPTTLNRQGNDIGTQYRSIIFFTSSEQKEKAEKVISDLQPEFENKIVTEVKKLEKFYQAEDYHQNFYNKNSGNVYCRFVIDPKINKLKKEFKSLVK